MFNNLEKTILRYRTNEMMRLLFHIEDLRKFLVGSIEASNLFLDESDERFFNKKKKVMPQVWKRIIDDNILNTTEVEDLKSIIDKRNTIAHEVHKFTRDLHSELKEYTKTHHFEAEYDYGALERLLKYKVRIESKWKGIFELSFRSLDFELADQFYKSENTYLRHKINKLYEQRRKVIESANKELEKVSFPNYEEYPQNHRNFREDGSLSIQGGETCRGLLSKGLSCLAVSILMDIDVKRVEYQKRKLQKRT
ncbi:hypothetical protein DLH88_24900 [Vibrio parahaemolyticus]|uniref:hypothetical protein n=1 Tax=Vibrio parahaemolyticus TaxID=670 RepID=UPI000A1FFF7B|nr:hypothetical protein [Vibrio parahaemolyticus]EGR2914540.1 hypothetical protein [Vibrio parahaemolyticus]EGR3155027.1 hypothetical protein [Vibrio parahaemolyticus]EIE1212869.1 hypothetical protein [Vibrio parahaemolyticus]EJC7076393.1 hypothetical protein [Vibrio parahaemolyticus]EKN4540282.1 hypothetical protein [Vibrio parahaemolyticus]